MKNHGVAVVINKGNKYLLLEDSRKLMRGKWGPPHGRCENADKIEKDSVIRETLEETGLTVKPLRKIWTTKADVKTDTISFWLAKIVKGKIKIDKRESSNYGWFTINEIFNLNLYPGTRKFFNLVERGEITIDKEVPDKVN
jgi:8-oxo-dGTP pyrophosphatase MutT (NUDIX family)